MLSINDYSFGIGISELMLSQPLWKAFRAIGMGITTTAAVMAPHEVLAIDFRFFMNNSGLNLIEWNEDGTFTVDYEIEGLISGLDDNQTNQLPLRLDILKSRNDSLAVGSYAFTAGSGFTVSDGEITMADWIGVLNSQDHYRRLSFFDDKYRLSLWATLKTAPPLPPEPPMPPFLPVWIEGLGYVTPICACMTTTVPDYNYGSAPIFVPVSQQPLNLTPTFIRSTPGPLPILGALALHHSSRRLRRRLRQGLKD